MARHAARRGKQLQRELEEMVDSYGPRGAAFESLTADLERLTTYLDEELDPAAKGVVVIACHQQGVFEPVPLDVPVDSGFTVGPIPSLRQLVHAAEDYPPYAVLVADQRDAFLWLMDRQTWERGVALEASDYPRKQQQGGWSQQRYQAAPMSASRPSPGSLPRRRGGHWVRVVTRSTISSSPPTSRCSPPSTRNFTRPSSSGSWAESTSRSRPASPRLPRKRSPWSKRRSGGGRWRRSRRSATASAPGRRGVAGAQDTITALETGQVMTLVMNDDFSQPGWADYTLPLFGVGSPPREHPAGGDVANLVPTAVEDEVVRLALQIGAEVQLVRSAVPVGEEEQEQIPDADEPTPRSEAARALDELGRHRRGLALRARRRTADGGLVVGA